MSDKDLKKKEKCLAKSIIHMVVLHILKSWGVGRGGQGSGSGTEGHPTLVFRCI